MRVPLECDTPFIASPCCRQNRLSRLRPTSSTRGTKMGLVPLECVARTSVVELSRLHITSGVSAVGAVVTDVVLSPPR